MLSSQSSTPHSSFPENEFNSVTPRTHRSLHLPEADEEWETSDWQALERQARERRIGSAADRRETLETAERLEKRNAEAEKKKKKRAPWQVHLNRVTHHTHGQKFTGTPGPNEVTTVTTAMPPLCHAAFSNDAEGVAAMLTAVPGIHPNDPRETSWYGHTPLHYAAQYNYTDIVRLLLTARASTEVRNDMGQTPLELCQKVTSARPKFWP